MNDIHVRSAVEMSAGLATFTRLRLLVRVPVEGNEEEQVTRE